MTSSKNLYALVILGIFALTVLLYFGNKKGKPTQKKEASLTEAKASMVDLKTYSDSVLKTFDSVTIELINKLQAENKASSFDSIVTVVLPKSATVAAFFLEKNAQMQPNSESWKKAGTLFYKATRFEPQHLTATLYAHATQCLDKATQLNNSDLEAATMLGTCYVEGGSQPMEGITILKNVLEKDSTYINAHIQLGVFALQSGQMEKAADRFLRILQIKPDYIEAYIYLGQVYADWGKKEQAIEMLEKYMKKSNDITINKQVEQFISELKKH